MTQGKMLVLGCVVCLLAAGCTERARTETSQGMDLTQTADKVQADLQKAKQEAEKVAEQARIEAEKAKEQARIDAQKAEEQARMEAEKAAEQAKTQVEDKVALAKDILAQAKELLENGQLEAAIKRAQLVLDEYDPNSSIALNIINTAQNELKRKVEGQAAAVQEGVQGVIGGMGQ